MAASSCQAAGLLMFQNKLIRDIAFVASCPSLLLPSKELKTIEPEFFHTNHSLASHEVTNPSQHPIHTSTSPCSDIQHALEVSRSTNPHPPLPGNGAKTLASVPAHDHGWDQQGEAVLHSDGAYYHSGSSVTSSLQEIECLLESHTARWLGGIRIESTQAVERPVVSGRQHQGGSKPASETEQNLFSPPLRTARHSLDSHFPASAGAKATATENGDPPKINAPSLLDQLPQRAISSAKYPPESSASGQRENLFSAARESTCSVARGRFLLFHWLLSLPTSLVARWFAGRRKCRRLGEHYALCVEFLLRFSPFLSLHSIHTGLQLLVRPTCSKDSSNSSGNCNRSNGLRLHHTSVTRSHTTISTASSGSTSSASSGSTSTASSGSTSTASSGSTSTASSGSTSSASSGSTSTASEIRNAGYAALHGCRSQNRWNTEACDPISKGSGVSVGPAVDALHLQVEAGVEFEAPNARRARRKAERKAQSRRERGKGGVRTVGEFDVLFVCDSERCRSIDSGKQRDTQCDRCFDTGDSVGNWLPLQEGYGQLLSECNARLRENRGGLQAECCMDETWRAGFRASPSLSQLRGIATGDDAGGEKGNIETNPQAEPGYGSDRELKGSGADSSMLTNGVSGIVTDGVPASDDASHATRAQDPALWHWELTVKFLLYVGPWPVALAARRGQQRVGHAPMGVQGAGALASEAIGSNAHACTSHPSPTTQAAATACQAASHCCFNPACHWQQRPHQEANTVTVSQESPLSSSRHPSPAHPISVSHCQLDNSRTSSTSSSTSNRTSSTSSTSNSTSSTSSFTTTSRSIPSNSSSSTTTSDCFLGQFLGPHAGVSLRDRRSRLIRQLALGQQGLGCALLCQLYAPARDDVAHGSTDEGNVAGVMSEEVPNEPRETGGGELVGFASGLGFDVKVNDGDGRGLTGSNTHPTSDLEGEHVDRRSLSGHGHVSGCSTDAGERGDDDKVVARIAALIQGYLFYEHPLWVQLSKMESKDEDRDRGRPGKCEDGASDCHVDPVGCMKTSVGRRGHPCGVGDGTVEQVSIEQQQPMQSHCTDCLRMDEGMGTSEGVEESRQQEEEEECYDSTQANASKAATRASATKSTKMCLCSATFGHLSPAHWTGWWTRDIGDVAYRAESSQSRWAILPKEQWLSPVMVLGGNSERVDRERGVELADTTGDWGEDPGCAEGGDVVDGSSAVRETIGHQELMEEQQANESHNEPPADSPPIGSFEEVSFDPTQQRPLILLTASQLVAVAAARSTDAVERKTPRKLRFLVAELQWMEGFTGMPSRSKPHPVDADVAGEGDTCAAAGQENVPCPGGSTRQAVDDGMARHGDVCAARSQQYGCQVEDGRSQHNGRCGTALESCSGGISTLGSSSGDCAAQEGGENGDRKRLMLCNGSEYDGRQQGAWVEVSRGFVVEPSWPDTKEFPPTGYHEVMQRPYW